MKNLTNLVKSFIASNELNGKLRKGNQMKMNFVLSLNDKQCIDFLKFYFEMEELPKSKVKG